MKSFIIFYATSVCNDTVTIYAESFNEAYKFARAFSLSRSVTILGIFSQSSYIELHPHE